MHHQKHALLGKLRDRGEVLHRIVGERLVDRGSARVNRFHIDHEGVAVGLGFRHIASSGRTTSAALVYDDNRLLELARKLLTDDTAGKIGGATGRKADGRDPVARDRRRLRVESVVGMGAGRGATEKDPREQSGAVVRVLDRFKMNCSRILPACHCESRQQAQRLA